MNYNMSTWTWTIIDDDHCSRLEWNRQRKTGWPIQVKCYIMVHKVRLGGGRFRWEMKLMLRSTSLGDQRLKCFPLQPAFWTGVVIFYVAWLVRAHIGVSVVIRLFQLEVQVELAAGALFASALCLACSLKYDMNI